MSASATPDIDAFQTWHSSKNRLQVRYPASLLRRIDADVIEAFSAFRRGGLEIGGVLFGTHDDDGVTLNAVRPIACEHRFGPNFELSETDEAALRELLAQSGEGDAELRGLEPVGWFHSHTRSELDLTEQDAYLHAKYFGKPWQIALVLKPEQLRPTRAALYLPEEDGTVRPGAPEDTIELAARRPAGTDVIEVEPAPAETALVVVPAVEVTEPAAEPVPYAPPRPQRRSYRAAIAVCALIAGMGSAAVYTAMSDRSDPASAPELGLHISGASDQLAVAWNPPRGAQGADLEIRDGVGEPQFVHLSAQQVAGGRLTYVRRAPEVSMRMRVYGVTAAPLESTASFLGPPVRRAEIAAVAAQPMQSPPQVPSPAPAQAISQAPEPAQAAAASSVKFPADTGQRARLTPEPVVVRAPEPAVVALPPVLAVSPDLGRSPASLTPIAPRPWTEPPPPSPSPVAQQQRRAPASGRAIWTGALMPGATVSFEGGRPSSGSLNGRLPQHVRVTAHVADLSPAGIVVYTSDASQRARVGTSESPSARNGWNLTTWRWDDKRAATVRVIEAPGPRNNWSRLTVRGEGKKVSVLILDWEEIPTPPSN